MSPLAIRTSVESLLRSVKASCQAFSTSAALDCLPWKGSKTGVCRPPGRERKRGSGVGGRLAPEVRDNGWQLVLSDVCVFWPLPVPSMLKTDHSILPGPSNLPPTAVRPVFWTHQPKPSKWVPCSHMNRDKGKFSFLLWRKTRSQLCILYNKRFGLNYTQCTQFPSF